MTFKPYENEYAPLSDRLIGYYRDVVAVHADDPVVGACLICRASKCEDWRQAFERLNYAAEAPATPTAVAPAQRLNGGGPT